MLTRCKNSELKKLMLQYRLAYKCTTYQQSSSKTSSNMSRLDAKDQTFRFIMRDVVRRKPWNFCLPTWRPFVHSDSLQLHTLHACLMFVIKLLISRHQSTEK